MVISENTKEEQNVKRRVYDALNVLISAGVLKKCDKKVECFENSFLVGNSFMNQIRGELRGYNKEIEEKKQQILEKKKIMKEMIYKYLALKQLNLRNERYEKQIREEEELSFGNQEQNDLAVFHQENIKFESKLQQQPITKKKIYSLRNNEKKYCKPMTSQPKKQTEKQKSNILCIKNKQLIAFPFILFSTTQNQIEIQSKNDNKYVEINSLKPLEILGDIDVLLKMKFHKDSEINDSSIKELIPQEVLSYLQSYGI
eukprot:TRINITY_DN16109_c0_g1_i2.p2 TRINITY_DN16109_c0_g1~~TRINITY_DN16109_c0_g1_i2.p2  ORF type:complete len:257 (+),score=54.10 TRINITY_DN16109_c0_g1_i2:788-1558(+)